MTTQAKGGLLPDDAAIGTGGDNLDLADPYGVMRRHYQCKNL